MCKISINNMLWLALMSVVQNKHFPMLESRRYAVRQSQRLSKWCQELNHNIFFFFFFFTASSFENDPIFWQFQKPIMDIFLQFVL